MGMPVATVGHKFRGFCQTCSRMVEGEMIEGSPLRMIEGQPICVTGSRGLGYCGHTCEAIGQSAVSFIDGIPVARKGDPVSHGIEGELIEGSDFVTSD